MTSNVGKQVVFLNKELHSKCPYFYPEVGTVGTIVSVDEQCRWGQPYEVQWPAGSTSDYGRWWVYAEDVRFLNSTDFTIPNALYYRLDKCLVNLMKGETVNIKEVEQLHGWMNRLRREQNK